MRFAWLVVLLLTSSALANPPRLDSLGRCINQKNVDKNGLIGDCDAQGNFTPHATMSVKRAPVPQFSSPDAQRDYWHRGGR
jgi:hypothetical protein